MPLGWSPNHIEGLLCPILMKMIPEEITLEFMQKMDEGSVSKVKELMDYLKREVE